MFRFDKEFRSELRDSWGVLAIGFCALLFGLSAPVFSLPFIFGEVIEEFGWTREQVTLLSASKFLTGAVVALLVGRFIDLIGVGPALILTTSTGAIAMVSFLWIQNLTFYYLAGMLMGFAGPGTIVAVKVLVSRNFHASQGTAMGLTLLGASVGSVLVPLAISALIAAFGWRGGMAAMSLGVWVIALPLLLIASARLKAFRNARPASKTPEVNASPVPSLLPLVYKGQFWLLVGVVFLASAVDQGFIQHQVLVFEDLDISRKMIAIGVSAIGLVGFISRVIVGNVLDSMSNKGLSLLYLTLTASALMALLLVNPFVFIGFIILRAVGHASVLLDTTVMTKHMFGLQNYGTLIGIFTAVGSAGFALGTWLMGWLHDASGSYTSSFVLFAALSMIGALMAWFLKPTYWLAAKGKGDPAP